MPNEPISQLTQTTSPSATDVVPIVSQGSTYKVSLNTLVQAASANVFGAPFIYKSATALNLPGSTTNTFPVANLMTVFPYPVTQPLTISAISLNLAATPASGITLQMGIYNATSIGNMPGNLISASTATITPSATGIQTYNYTTNLLLSPGIYWLAGVVQGGTPSTHQLFTCALYNLPYPTLQTSTIIGYTMNVAGALPTTFSITGVATGAIRIYLTAV